MKYISKAQWESLLEYIADLERISRADAAINLRGFTERSGRHILNILGLDYNDYICPECGEEFEPKRKDRKYCTKACGDRRRAREAYRRKKEAINNEVHNT